LSANKCNEAIKMLKEQHFDKIDWYYFSKNPCDEAMKNIKDNEDKINFGTLSSNTNPEAIKILKEKHFDKIDWLRMSENPYPAAIDLLIQYPDKVCIEWMTRNPGIFERDYIEMSKMRTMILLEDLMKNTLHPRRISRFLELVGNMDDYLIN